MTINVPFTNDEHPDYAFKIYMQGTNFKTTTGNNNNIAQNNINAIVDKENKSNIEDVITINPNPTKGLFYLNLNSENKDAQNADIIIYDVLGGKVFSNKINEKTTIINISDQPPGIYFVKLLFNNKILSCKLIKE